MNFQTSFFTFKPQTSDIHELLFLHFRPQTSYRTKRQLKCFWKNEKMKAKEEIMSLWKFKGMTQDPGLSEELTELSRGVYLLIPDKIRNLAENSYTGATTAETDIPVSTSNQVR